MDWSGAAASAASGIVGALAQSSANAANWSHTKELYQNRYQWTVNDMKAAGLNPILAATNSALAAPSTSSPAAQPVVSQGMASTIAHSAIEGQKLDIEKKKLENDQLRIENETRQVQANVERSQAESRVLADQLLTAANNREISSAKSAAEISEIRQRITNSVTELQHRIQNLDSSTALNWIKSAEASKMIESLGKSMDLTDQQIEVAKKRAADPSPTLANEWRSTFVGRNAYKLGVLLTDILGLNNVLSVFKH